MTIIARLPSFTFEVPDPPFRIGSSDVEAKIYIGPLSADDYIFTRCALPHQDDYFNDKWFVTLSLVSGFEFGDAKMRTGKRGTFINSNSNQVCAGDLIIVDRGGGLSFDNEAIGGTVKNDPEGLIALLQ